MPDFTSQQTLTAALLNAGVLPGRLINRGERTTASTAASAATGVLRVDGTAITSGRSYMVATNNLLMVASVANDTGTARVSYDAAGGTATTASSILCGWNSLANLTTSGNLNGVPALLGRFTATSTTTLSVLLFTQRLAGTGNISLSPTFGNIHLMIFDIGEDPGDTGIDL